jgi:hypothetical protein
MGNFTSPDLHPAPLRNNLGKLYPDPEGSRPGVADKDLGFFGRFRVFGAFLDVFEGFRAESRDLTPPGSNNGGSWRRPGGVGSTSA